MSDVNLATESTSILYSVKKVLNVAPTENAFDMDIILHINAAFSTLLQLGVGPDSGFFIEDESVTWTDFLGDEAKYNFVKTYVYIYVRLLFDPPTTSFGIQAFEKQKLELEWRISVAADKPKSFLELDTAGATWWDLTNLDVFPADALPGDLGYNTITGKVWRNL